MTQTPLWEPTLEERIGEARSFHAIGQYEANGILPEDAVAEFDALIEDIRKEARVERVELWRTEFKNPGVWPKNWGPAEDAVLDAFAKWVAS